MSLEPEIPGNRDESDRLLRRRRQVLVISIVLVIPASMLTPARYAPAAAGGVLVASLLLMAYPEWKRVLVFRRDLVQRRESDEAMP